MPEMLLKKCREMGIPYGEPVPLLVDDFEDALAFIDPDVSEFQAMRTTSCGQSRTALRRRREAGTF